MRCQESAIFLIADFRSISAFYFSLVRFVPRIDISHKIICFYSTKISVFTHRIGEVLFIAFQ